MLNRLGPALVAATTAAALLPMMAAASAAAVPPKTVKVAYGDGPVVQDSWDQVVRIAFRGKAGDRVALEGTVEGWDSDCESRALEGRGGKVLQRLSGFHVLPDAGRYVFTYSQDCWVSGGGDMPESRAVASLQLVKLRVRSLRPGARVRLPHRQGYVTAARVRVGRRAPARVLRVVGGRSSLVALTPTSQRTEADRVESGPRADGLGGPLLLERGAPLAVNPTVGRHSARAERGSHLFHSTGRTVTLALSRVLPALRTTFTSPAVRVRPRALSRMEFRGRKGQWVRLTGAPEHSYRLGASPARTVVLKDDGLWRLPATGTFRLDLVGSARKGSKVAVRRIVAGKALVAGEAPAVREVESGQWSVFPVRAPQGSRWFFTVPDADLEHGWSATAHGDESDLYQRWYAGCLSGEGVGENSVVSPSYVVVRPGPGAGGSLTMGFQDQPASPQPEYPEQMCWW